MLSIGLVAFVYPWLLAGLAALPAIWWLMRASPPLPRLEWFPAIRLLRDLESVEQSPERTPWWLILLRMALAAFVILGLARPLINPPSDNIQDGLLMIVADDGWAAGAKWELRKAEMAKLIALAGQNSGEVILVTTARSEDLSEPALMLSEAANSIAATLEPKPWGLDRAAAAKRIMSLKLSDAQRARLSIVWLTDGLSAMDDSAGASQLMKTLASLGPVRMIADPVQDDLVILAKPRATSAGFDVRVLRPYTATAYSAQVQIRGDDGRILHTAPVNFAIGQNAVDVSLSLPVAVRNAAAQVQLSGVNSAAGIWLLDDQWKRITAGVVSGGGFEDAQPLLDDVFYLERAMQPFAEVRKGALSELLKEPLSMLVLADIGMIVGDDRDQVERWLEQGGVLVRFAGPRMVEKSDELVPVRPRRGGRSMGGAVSWDAPVQIAPFPAASPFFGLAISEDITVSRQLLAEPEAGIADKAWASLRDGTPLVTAARRGKGWVVMFHVTANTRWSTLPLTGLYVAMLQRISELASGVTVTDVASEGAAAASLNARPKLQLSPWLLLDGRGRLRPPAPDSPPLQVAQWENIEAGPRSPPGYYGDRESPRQAGRQNQSGGNAVTGLRAINLNCDAACLGPLPPLPDSMIRASFGPQQEQELRPWLLSGAMLLLIADGVIALGMLGYIPQWRARGRSGAANAAMALLFFGAIVAGGCAYAQDSDPQLDRMAQDAVLQTRLAYVVTGDAEVDAMSASGLSALSKVLRDRTAFEAAEPFGVRVEHDELVFYPLLYWPMSVLQAPLTAQGLARIDAYIKNGGTILFDTRDELTGFNGVAAGGSVGPGQEVLRRILAGLDIPPLATPADDHVLTKSFYLMQDFPGRYYGGQLWVEVPASGVEAANSKDGVSSIVIGSNDWAAAWAADSIGRPLVPISPGGSRQREMAYRFGVNLVMYTLTGNYKGDQVHVPVLRERLGQ